MNRRGFLRVMAVSLISTDYAETGGLISYSPDYPELFRRADMYVDKILKGAKPADLPFEQPTKFEPLIRGS